MGRSSGLPGHLLAVSLPPEAAWHDCFLLNNSTLWIAQLFLVSLNDCETDRAGLRAAVGGEERQHHAARLEM